MSEGKSTIHGLNARVVLEDSQGNATGAPAGTSRTPELTTVSSNGTVAAGKRSVTIAGPDDPALDELLRTADVVIETPGFPDALEPLTNGGRRTGRSCVVRRFFFARGQVDGKRRGVQLAA